MDIVQVEHDGPLRVLRLNDPRRANPLSAELVEALTRKLEAAADADGVRAVVLAGEGRHFSAGADLAALERMAASTDVAGGREDSRRLERLFAVLLGHPKLTVAAVHGAAIAGGCGLATACDLVVAERGATFAYTEVRIGFVPALVSTFLTRRVTGGTARRLLLDPRRLDADEAASIGLVDRVVEPDQALSAAREWALEVARSASPSALAATKALLNEVTGMHWRDALTRAAEVNAAQRLHPECRRGVRTFLDSKSTPDWLEEP